MEMLNPFRKISSKEIYKNKWIRLVEDRVERPDGSPGIFGIVTMCPGSTVAAVDEEGYIYLAKEYKYAIGRESIELISGGMDEDEDPLIAAQRELNEEIGLTASSWTKIGTVDPFTTVINCPNHLFLAEGLQHVPFKADRNEIVESLRVPLVEAVKMVHEGKITHGASCVAILLVARHFHI